MSTIIPPFFSRLIEEIVDNAELVLGTQTGTTNYETALQYLTEDRIQAFE